MIAGRNNDSAPPGPSASSAQCLLLIRAPSDREIYDAFRAIAAHAKHTCVEHLWIEGDLPLTAGLCAPQAPPTVERLLNADCEMIDKLELEFGGFRWTYIRSGGHAPFRESFFDEVHIEQIEPLALVGEELRVVLQSALSALPVLSHSGSGGLLELVSEIQADSGGSYRTLPDETGANRIWIRS
jgi:hypothetical protein